MDRRHSERSAGAARARWAAASAAEQERWVASLGALAGFELVEWASYSCAGVSHRLACYRHALSGARFHLAPGEPAFRCGGDPDPYGAVEIPPLLVAAAPLSGREWRALGGAAEADELPAGGVSWLEARARLRAAGLRLPREAEWVYLARAGVAGRYWWGGEDFDPGASWHLSNSGGGPRPSVAHAERRNAFGLVDVTGNVWEWCEEDLDLAMEGSAWQEGNPGKVHRGGSYDTPRRSAALDARAGSDPRATYPDLGVRPVADVLQAAS